jgi:Protein of unknown function (DUF3303)
MLYMVIERFNGKNAAAVYERFHRMGRMMPDGLKYLDSWTETNDDRCFQLMETGDPQTFSAWTAAWSDPSHDSCCNTRALRDVASRLPLYFDREGHEHQPVQLPNRISTTR